MEAFWNVLSSQSVLLLFFAVGVLLLRCGVLSETGVEDLTRLVVQALLPITIFQSFQMELAGDDLRMALLLLVISSGVCLLSYGAGKLFFGRYPAPKQSVMRYSALISNCTFVGLPLLSAIYGAKGVFYASVFVIPNRFFMWSLGVLMFDRGGVSLRASLKKMLLNPCMIACFLGVGCMVVGLRLPPVLDRVLSALDGCTGPLSMITIGAILARVPLAGAFKRDSLYICAVRLVILPLAVWALLTACGVEPLVLAVSVLMTGMPLANTVILLAKRYACEVELAAQATLASVLLSLLTVPLTTFLF